MFLVIPAAVIALLVLILGSILVVAQQTMTAYGTRAALMLAGDTRAQGSIARALLISVAAVLLAGQLPEHGRPAPSITAGAATLALATAFSILVVARQLTVILLRYTAPVAFAAAVLEGVESTLARGKTSRIVFRVPLFGEMMKSCIRRGDSIGTTVAVDGLIRFTQAYIRGTRSQPGREVSHIRRRWHRSRVVGRASSGRLCTRRFGRFCAGRT